MRILLASGALFFVSTCAHAGDITWTKWKTDTIGIQGEAKGAIPLQAGRVQIRYKGEVEPESSLGRARPDQWQPASSWAGGVVGNAPISGNQIAFYGGPATNVNVISFSVPVTNPIIAIYSLGAGSLKADMDFKGVSLTFEAGGPSKQHRGGPVQVIGTHIIGMEGNGTVQLNGTFTKIKFSTPVYEDWCGFTIGLPQSANQRAMPASSW